MPHSQQKNPFRISGLELDEASVERRSPEIDQEREIAIYDLLEENRFEPNGSDGGPYKLVLGIAENRLVFDIRREDGATHKIVALSLTPFRRIVKDYFMICESYHAAIREAPPSHIEAIDMGRRGLHDEGAGILKERLAGKVEIDFDTARRLFTLISALHLKA